MFIVEVGIKMKRILFLASLLLVVGGCSNSQFKPNYDNMQVSDDGINGYSLDLRVYGKVGTDVINKIVKLDNYKNQQYKIINIDAKVIDDEGRTKEDILYVLNGKLYVEDDKGKYIEDTENTKYINSSIYLNGLKNVTNVSDSKEKTVGDATYDVYDVTFNKKNVKNIIDDLDIKGLESYDGIKGQIYLDKEGYVNSVIYNIGTLTINANYYRINKSTEINFPAEIGAVKK
jgi:hypothetical protein